MSYQPNAPGDWGAMQGSDTISISQEELLTKDGHLLFMRSWKTDNPLVLLIVHGLGGHSGWYIDMGNHISSHGITVYAMDLRGFGRSGGIRGHIDDYHTLVNDVGFVLAEIQRRHSSARIFLLGHSMGAAIAMHVAATYEVLLSGILLLNMWVQETRSPSLLPTLSIFIRGILDSRDYWQFGDKTEGMTSNPEAAQMLRADPFWQKEETVTFLVQTFFMRQALPNQARRIPMPILFLQGEADTSVKIDVNRALYEAATTQDKLWHSYPGYDHDSEFQRDRSQLDRDIVHWLFAHAAGKPTTVDQTYETSEIQTSD